MPPTSSAQPGPELRTPQSAGGIADAMRGRRILVTGHTGFKGAWLCQWLLSIGATPIGLALDPPSTPSLFDVLGLSRTMEDHRVDVRDAAGVRRVVHGAGASVIIHMAAQALVRPSYADPVGTFETNVTGTANLLEAIRTRPVADTRCAVVIVTSDKCYRPNPTPHAHREEEPLGGKDPYSASKAAAEIVAASFRDSFFAPASLARHGVALATARAGNVIGGGDWALDRLVPDIATAMSKGTPVVLRNPASDRPWQHVLDALSGYLHLAALLLGDDAPRHARAFNFGPDDADPSGRLSVRDLTARMVRAWRRIDDDRIDVRDGYSERPDPNDPPESPHLGLSIALAREQLRWRPTWTAAEAVTQTAAWYRAFLTEHADARDLTLAQIAAFTSHARERGRAWSAPTLDHAS